MNIVRNDFIQVIERDTLLKGGGNIFFLKIDLTLTGSIFDGNVYTGIFIGDVYMEIFSKEEDIIKNLSECVTSIYSNLKNEAEITRECFYKMFIVNPHLFEEVNEEDEEIS